MNILALEPYYTGSHRAFLDGWSSSSRHQWTVLGLPGYKWKWRMRHGALTLADEANQLLDQGQAFDLVFCSDMLNLAEFRGLVNKRIGQLPAVVYFHENQLTYPSGTDTERDYHFAMTNFATAVAADRVWFNSAFHRDSFLPALAAFLDRMPDYRMPGAVDEIRHKSAVFHPGIEPMTPRPEREAGPLRVLWAARWEHDKNPGDFFAAMDRLADRGIDFRLHVLGERFENVPEVFDSARGRFADRIDHWGYIESRQDYVEVLLRSDVVVSTAIHEFFGIAVVEAIAAGARPIVPNRLAYPEIVGGNDTNRYFYDGTVDGLVEQLNEIDDRLQRTGSVWENERQSLSADVRRFVWERQAPVLDSALEDAAFGRSG